MGTFLMSSLFKDISFIRRPLFSMGRKVCIFDKARYFGLLSNQS
jgi:hypothetical protein